MEQKKMIKMYHKLRNTELLWRLYLKHIFYSKLYKYIFGLNKYTYAITETNEPAGINTKEIYHLLFYCVSCALI